MQFKIHRTVLVITLPNLLGAKWRSQRATFTNHWITCAHIRWSVFITNYNTGHGMKKEYINFHRNQKMPKTRSSMPPMEPCMESISISFSLVENLHLKNFIIRLKKDPMVFRKLYIKTDFSKRTCNIYSFKSYRGEDGFKWKRTPGMLILKTFICYQNRAAYEMFSTLVKTINEKEFLNAFLKCKNTYQTGVVILKLFDPIILFPGLE